MFVKLCGLRTLEDAQAAIAADADALGFILAESKRQVSVEFVAALRDHLLNPPTLVGVTVNRHPADLNIMFKDARLDMIQLSGDEDVSILDQLDMPVIKALRFSAGADLNSATREVDAWFSHRHAPELIIVEGHSAGSFGGSGMTADWKLMHEIAVRYPVVLAGGLTPDNVRDAIREVQPIGVDTSSGTETDGVKDPAKLTQFVQMAKRPIDRF